VQHPSERCCLARDPMLLGRCPDFSGGIQQLVAKVYGGPELANESILGPATSRQVRRICRNVSMSTASSSFGRRTFRHLAREDTASTWSRRSSASNFRVCGSTVLREAEELDFELAQHGQKRGLTFATNNIIVTCFDQHVQSERWNQTHLDILRVYTSLVRSVCTRTIKPTYSPFSFASATISSTCSGE
jgi:hypothetical protein